MFTKPALTAARLRRPAVAVAPIARGAWAKHRPSSRSLLSPPTSSTGTSGLVGPSRPTRERGASKLNGGDSCLWAPRLFRLPRAPRLSARGPRPPRRSPPTKIRAGIPSSPRSPASERTGWWAPPASPSAPRLPYARPTAPAGSEQSAPPSSSTPTPDSICDGVAVASLLNTTLVIPGTPADKYTCRH